MKSFYGIFGRNFAIWFVMTYHFKCSKVDCCRFTSRSLLDLSSTKVDELISNNLHKKMCLLQCRRFKDE